MGFLDKILGRMRMPKAEVQTEPQDVIDEQLLRDEDEAINR